MSPRSRPSHRPTLTARRKSSVSTAKRSIDGWRGLAEALAEHKPIPVVPAEGGTLHTGTFGALHRHLDSLSAATHSVTAASCARRLTDPMRSPAPSPRPKHLFVLALGFCALAGCASSSIDLAPASPSTPFKPEAQASMGAASPATTASGARDFGLAPAMGLPIAESDAALDPTHVYGLAELIDLAQTTNPQTRSSWELARQAALAVGITKALYLPVVTATVVGGYQRFSNSGQLANLPSSSTSGDAHGTLSGVALQWLLFDFGERDALTRAAADRSFASNIAFNGTHQKIIYDVSRAFYEYTSARQRVSIARQSKIETARLRDAAHARLTQGVGTTVETAQADQLYVQSAFDLVQAEGGERDRLPRAGRGRRHPADEPHPRARCFRPHPAAFVDGADRAPPRSGDRVPSRHPGRLRGGPGRA